MLYGTVGLSVRSKFINVSSKNLLEISTCDIDPLHGVHMIKCWEVMNYLLGCYHVVATLANSTATLLAM